MTVQTLAYIILAYFGVAAVWDLIDPRAVKLSFGSNMRLVVAVVAQVAIIWLVLLVVSASAAASVAFVLGYLLIIALAAGS